MSLDVAVLSVLFHAAVDLVASAPASRKVTQRRYRKKTPPSHTDGTLINS